MQYKVQQIFQFYANTFFPDNNDAKPNNVESAASGSNADPYAASVSAALSSMNINAEGGAPNNSTMNNGRKDTTHSDVQKLQEQLNDIKEQVCNSL